jgi:hypothetical protein
MADEVETDGGSEDGAGSTPDPETPADGGAEAESPSASDATDSDASPAAESDASATDEPEEFKNALGKHKGDKAAFGRHYWQTQQDNARIAKENADLKAKLAEHDTGRPREVKAPEPEPVDVSPELKELESQLGALEEEKKAFPKEQQERISAATQAWRTVVQLETKLEGADEVDKSTLENRVAIAKRELRDARQDVANGETRQKALDADIKRNQRERDGLKRQLESDKARQEQAKRDEKEFNQSFPQEVDGYIFSALDELKVPKGADPKADKLRESIWGSTNEALIVSFRRLHEQGVPLSEVDVPKLVRDTTKKVVERYDTYARGKFGLNSKDKLKVTVPAKPAPRPAAETTPKRPPLPYETEEEVDPRLVNARKRLAARGL